MGALFPSQDRKLLSIPFGAALPAWARRLLLAARMAAVPDIRRNDLRETDCSCLPWEVFLLSILPLPSFPKVSDARPRSGIPNQLYAIVSQRLFAITLLSRVEDIDDVARKKMSRTMAHTADIKLSRLSRRIESYLLQRPCFSAACRAGTLCLTTSNSAL